MSQVAVFPPKRIKRFLRNAELFEMLSEADLDRLLKVGGITNLGPGDILFEAGDPSDRIHLVLEGALEILRATPDQPERVPVAYISPGEIIGDMALLTGSPRRSGSRVPERLLVWTLTRKDFEDFATATPGYWRSISKVYARRLEHFITRMRRQTRRKELSGKLEYFDLPTVVQTLISSNQTGLLCLIDEEGETFAEVLMCEGAIERARCGPLEGEEAFHEIFLAGLQGHFYFRTITDPDPDSISRMQIHPTSINLLMEAVRRVDELSTLRDRLDDSERAFVTQTDKIDWEDEKSEEIAARIFEELRTPKKLSSLVQKVPCSTFTLHEVAVKLYETEQIG